MMTLWWTKGTLLSSGIGGNGSIIVASFIFDRFCTVLPSKT
jgi:hypothetical protein